MTTGLSDELKKQIENATVGILDPDGFQIGQGVFIAGGYILTAAHCAVSMYMTEEKLGCNLCCSGRLQLSNEYLVGKVKLNDDMVLPVVPILWEAVNDIAVFTDLDPCIYDTGSEFEEAVINHPPVRMFVDFPNLINKGTSFSVHVLQKDGHWSSGEGIHIGNSPQIGIMNLSSPLQSGTSGGPIVNDDGKLVGIVSQGTHSCSGACPNFLLPCYLLNKIQKDEVSFFDFLEHRDEDLLF
jgi:hypothetical protein